METNFIGTLAVTQAMLPLLRKSDAGRIVNLSSALGSLAVNSDPSSPFYSARLIGYNASKAAVNMLTAQLCAELRDTPIVVNSVSPGSVKTDLTGHTGFMTPSEGARMPVNMPCSGTKWFPDGSSDRTVARPGRPSLPYHRRAADLGRD